MLTTTRVKVLALHVYIPIMTLTKYLLIWLLLANQPICSTFSASYFLVDMAAKHVRRESSMFSSSLLKHAWLNTNVLFIHNVLLQKAFSIRSFPSRVSKRCGGRCRVKVAIMFECPGVKSFVASQQFWRRSLNPTVQRPNRIHSSGCKDNTCAILVMRFLRVKPKCERRSSHDDSDNFQQAVATFSEQVSVDWIM